VGSGPSAALTLATAAGEARSSDNSGDQKSSVGSLTSVKEADIPSGATRPASRAQPDRKVQGVQWKKTDVGFDRFWHSFRR